MTTRQTKTPEAEAGDVQGTPPEATEVSVEAEAIGATYAVAFPAISLYVAGNAQFVGIGDLPVVDGHVKVPKGHKVAAANEAAASVLFMAQSCGQLVVR